MKNLSTLKRIVHKADPSLSQTESAFKASVVILASAVNELRTVDELAKFTGYPMIEIQPWLDNMKHNGLGWKRTRFYQSGWDDPETGGAAFWLDVCVALGYIEKKA